MDKIGDKKCIFCIPIYSSKLVCVSYRTLNARAATGVYILKCAFWYIYIHILFYNKINKSYAHKTTCTYIECVKSQLICVKFITSSVTDIHFTPYAMCRVTATPQALEDIVLLLCFLLLLVIAASPRVGKNP